MTWNPEYPLPLTLGVSCCKFPKQYFFSLQRLWFSFSLFCCCLFSGINLLSVKELSYGNEDDGDDLDEDVALATVLQNTAGTDVNATAGPSRANSKTCVCGGTDHLRRSSMLCPLNKRHSKWHFNYFGKK